MDLVLLARWRPSRLVPSVAVALVFALAVVACDQADWVVVRNDTDG